MKLFEGRINSKAGELTDELKRKTCGIGGSVCDYDDRGVLRTDGTRGTGDVSSGTAREGLFDRFEMEPEGYGTHLYDPNGPLSNRYLRYFVTDISKVHDYFNSWSYNWSTGFYQSGGRLFDSAFSLYSFSGMLPAAAITGAGYIGQVPGGPEALIRRRRERD